MASCARRMLDCQSKSFAGSTASEPSDYALKAKFGGMKVSDAHRPKALEAENG